MSQYVPQTDNPVGSTVLLIDPRASVSALLACAEQRIQAAKNLLRCSVKNFLALGSIMLR